MSTYSVFVDKMKKWYRHQLDRHYVDKDYYKDIDNFVVPEDITAGDEILAYNKDSAYREDHIVMDNAAHHQMEVRRCMNERDIPVDFYWDRWKRWIQYEYDTMVPFREIVEKKHVFIKGTSKPVRTDAEKFVGNRQLFDELFIDPLKAVDPDDGTK